MAGWRCALRGTTHRDIAAYAEAHPQQDIVKQSEREYVAFCLENFAAQYRTRAAIALARIGDPDAIARASRLLEEALERTEREDLQALLANTLEQLR